MRKHRRSLILAGCLALAAAGGGAAALADTNSATPGAALEASEPGSGHERRALGAQAAPAQPVFTLRDGDQVAVVRGTGGRCLIRTRDGSPAGESCAADATAASAGEGIAVTDECGTAGDHLMEITGLAPEGVSQVALRYDDGSSRTTTVVDGAFRFEGTNPAPGEPYPVSVAWLSGESQTGSAALPVRGGQFCLPTE